MHTKYNLHTLSTMIAITIVFGTGLPSSTPAQTQPQRTLLSITTPQEAQTARVEGVVFNAAVGVCRAIAAYEFSSHK